jgi:hypothetical protein
MIRQYILILDDVANNIQVEFIQDGGSLFSFSIPVKKVNRERKEPS